MFRFFLLLSYTLTCFCLQATEINSSNRIKAVDQQIADLKELLNKMELEKENEEVDSQKYIIADWNKYAQEIGEIRIKENYETQLLKRIQELEHLKSEL